VSKTQNKINKHKRPKEHGGEFTIKSIMSFLCEKYPNYAQDAHDTLVGAGIQLDTIIKNLRDAEKHMTEICSKVKLGFFETLIVKSIVKRDLVAKGMPA